MKRIAALFLTLMAISDGVWKRRDSASQPKWQQPGLKTVEDVSNAVAELVTGNVPILSQIAGDALAGQVRDNVVWSYSTPKPKAMKNTRWLRASVTLIELPLLGTKAYVASLPFILDVDTKAKTVERWSPDVLSATVEEQPSDRRVGKRRGTSGAARAELSRSMSGE